MEAENGIKLVGQRGALTIRDCLDKLRWFCEHDAYPFYDARISEFSKFPNTLTEDMLRLVNGPMRGRSSRDAWRLSLGTELPELQAIPTEMDLFDISEDDYAAVRNRLRAFYDRVVTKRVADVAASKMLYLVRPLLTAISDNQVKQVLGVHRSNSAVDQAIAVTDGVRAIGLANLGEVARLQQQLAPRYPLSKVRILDILLWGDMAVAYNTQWRAAAKLRGWRSIGWTVQAKPVKDLYGNLCGAGCIKFGEFKLKSGIISPVYVDFRGLVSKPELLKEIGQALAGKAWEISCDRIAGIPYAGLPLGVAASITGDIPMIYPRKEVKEHGTRKLIEGEYREGEKVLVIDDIITDGASKIEAIRPLEEAGLKVTDVLIVLDREQGGDRILAKAGYKLHSLGKLSEVLDALVAAGKVEREMRERVAGFIAENQFA